jgi:hypothetical protein
MAILIVAVFPSRLSRYSLADRGHVDPEASLRDGYVRPNVINEFVFRYDLAGTLDGKDQNIERPAAERKREPVATQLSPIAREFKGTELQLANVQSSYPLL